MQKIHSFTTVTHLSRFTETTYKISHDSNIKCVSHFTISAVLPGGLGVGMGHPSLLGPVSSVSQPPRLAWFLFFTLPQVFGTLMHFRSFLFFSQSTADFLGNQNSLFPQCQFGGDPDKVNFDLGLSVIGTLFDGEYPPPIGLGSTIARVTHQSFHPPKQTAINENHACVFIICGMFKKCYGEN